MSFFSILENIFIGPLKLIFEVIFETAHRFVGHPGFAIVFLSLLMNILVLPLYRRADAMQEAARDTEARLQKGVSHIKKTFSGDERMMILQTYYRQNNYKPTSALNGSVSLLLEIPFFMAAYQFLSHLEILNGVSFGPIADLGQPDGLLTIGSFSVNVLPILMTLINVVSSALYLKGFPLKTKIQLYGMALFFLVFLYTSPACLVFYWTLNNLFSLVKTIFYKIKNPQAVLRYLLFALGIGLLVFGGVFYEAAYLWKKWVVIAVGILLLLPFAFDLIQKAIRKKEQKKTRVYTPNRKRFLAAALFLTALVGLLIPSTYISASPQEFVDITYYQNPLWYLVSSSCLAAGTFLVWVGVFYWLATPRGKVIFEVGLWSLSGVALVNYMFFGTKLGVLSPLLKYDNGVFFAFAEHAINIVAVLAVIALMVFLFYKWKKLPVAVLSVAALAMIGMSSYQMVGIQKSMDDISAMVASAQNETPHFQLSKNGKNVVVIMLDRALGEYVPYILQEKPELKEALDGFTYYSNVVSFGGFTNFGTPALLGGYEYTPVEMNRRAEEKLVEKHNEAHLVMPLLFRNAGFDVTLCDPVYTNYQWIPDLSVFDEYEGIDAYITKGRFVPTANKEAVVTNNHRNFFCFSLMKTAPVALQSLIYDEGRYNSVSGSADGLVYTTQTVTGLSVAKGLSDVYMKPYNSLIGLSDMTRVTNGDENTFLFFSNDTTHEPMLLQTPDYLPSETVDNTQYDLEHQSRFEANGMKLEITNSGQMAHYHANMAAYLRLVQWFDYLKENGVYDNTKIILVSDHGQNLGQLKELVMDNGEDVFKNVEMYFPLLMVKDFDRHGFTTSDAFMTNADVPTLAAAGLIESPKNPFSGKEINSDEKNAHDQFFILSSEWDVLTNNGNTFMPARWGSVKENIWNKENWTFYETETVLAEHKAP